MNQRLGAPEWAHAGRSTRVRLRVTNPLPSPLSPAGTPVQNNLEEVFGLLNVLDPEFYFELDDFMDQFGGRGTPTLEQVKVRGRGWGREGGGGRGGDAYYICWHDSLQDILCYRNVVYFTYVRRMV